MSDKTKDAAGEVTLRFRSSKRPQECGTLVLTETGQVAVRPSEEFLDELARLEEEACRKSRLITSKIGFGLLAAGMIAVVIGYMVGRIGGKLRLRVTSPRSVDEINMFGDVTGGFHFSIPDKFGQTIDLNWAKGEIDAREAGEFLKAARKFRKKPEDNPVFR